MNEDDIPAGFHTVNGVPASARDVITINHVAYHPAIQKVFFLAWQFFADPDHGEPTHNEDGSPIVIHQFILSVPVGSSGIVVPTVESEISFDVASFPNDALPGSPIFYLEVSEFHVNAAGEFICKYGGGNVTLIYKTYGIDGQLIDTGLIVEDAPFIELVQPIAPNGFVVTGLELNEIPEIGKSWACGDVQWGPNGEVVSVVSLDIGTNLNVDGGPYYRLMHVVVEGVATESIIIGDGNVDDLVVNLESPLSRIPYFSVGANGEVAWISPFETRLLASVGGTAPITGHLVLFYNGHRAWVDSTHFTIDREGNVICWYVAAMNTTIPFPIDETLRDRFRMRLAKLDQSLNPIWEHEPEEDGLGFAGPHIHVDDANNIYTFTSAGTTCFDSDGNPLPDLPAPPGVEIFTGPTVGRNAIESLDGGHH